MITARLTSVAPTSLARLSGRLRLNQAYFGAQRRFMAGAAQKAHDLRSR